IRDMPIWYHREADPGIQSKSMNHMHTSKCLHENHKVIKVRDAENLARCQNVNVHRARSNCACANCTDARHRGCSNPHECYKKALQLLKKLSESGKPDEDGSILFDKSITTTGTLADIFRIFTEGEVTNKLPDLRLDDMYATEEFAATDGSCFNNGQADAAAGAGVFFEEDDLRNKAICLPETMEQPNQKAEVVAVKQCVQAADEDKDLKIESDSKHAINTATMHRKKWEDHSYIGVVNKNLHKATIATLPHC
ncbi:hypothetical protein C8R43DRAFT_890587, partial [Mycena crocata]